MAQVVVKDLLTNYSRVGKGRVLLLIHGWGDSIAGLKALQQKLSTNFDTVAVDLPGFGGTQSPPEAWSLNEYADFIQAFVEKINLNLDVVIGHSNGGAVAIRALSRGLQAKNLVLIASAGIRGENTGRKIVLKFLTKAGKLVSKPLPSTVKRRLRSKLYKTVGSDMMVAEHLQETFKRVVSDDIRQDAAQLNIPTLLIYGENDTSTPVRFGEILKQSINRSKLVIIPRGDHWLTTNNTDQLVTNIREFTDA